MRRNLLFSIILLLLTLLAYANSYEASFHHDDVHVIVRNSHVKDLNNIPRFFFQPQMGSGIYTETSSYRPLLMATFAMNYYLGGLNVFGYHLVNLGLHAGCAILVYLILLHLFRFASIPSEGKQLRDPLIALFGALIFALHPVQTESVTYITGRSSSMTGLFFLGSFLTFLQYRETRENRYWIFSCLLYAGSLLVKETAVTLLPILVLFQWMFPEEGTPPKKYRVILPYLLLSLLYFLFRLYFFGSLLYGSRPVRPFYENLLSQTRAWVHYLGTLILPLNLNIDYDFPVSHSILEGQVVLSIFLLVGIFLVIWRLSRSNRLVGFFALWFAITLLPTNSVIALDDPVSDRWLYLSSVGYAALLAYAGNWIFQNLVEGKKRAAKVLFFFLCTLVVELYGFSTVLRNFTWNNDRSLWEDSVAKSPQKARPYCALGAVLAYEGKLEEARQSLERAIELAPRGGQAYINLGYVYSLQGKTEEAIAAYEKAIPLNPKLLPEIYNNLATIYLKQGQMEKAEALLLKAVEIRPHFAPPYMNLGILYEKKGNLDRAIEGYEKTIQLAPDYQSAYEALSFLYRQKGWKEKSRLAYIQFLKHASQQPTRDEPRRVN
jgi:tetratricopeptide (TPR) repeat protein